jgi:hypothetical protein
MRRESVRSTVICDPIISERNITRLPQEPSVELRASGDDLVEQGDDVVGLYFGHADDLGDEAGVEEDGLPACDRVHADQRVFGSYGFAPHGVAQVAGVLGLQVGGVQGREGFEVFLYVWAKHVVGGVLRGPEGVAAAAAWWACEDLQRCLGGRLDLVCDLSHVSIWCAGW